ncbi:MAG: hypothetical protein ACRDSR_04705 [Pseudonocardiaceae bacterium]
MRDGGSRRLRTTAITSQFVDQQLEHRVSDAALAARLPDRYQALCGDVFIAAPLAAPPGPPCPACAAVLATASGTTATQRRRGLLRRLLPR